MVKSPHWGHKSHGMSEGMEAWQLTVFCRDGVRRCPMPVSGHPSIRNASRMRSWPEILRRDSHQQYKVLKRGQTRQRHGAVGSWPSPAPPAPGRGQCECQAVPGAFPGVHSVVCPSEGNPKRHLVLPAMEKPLKSEP